MIEPNGSIVFLGDSFTWGQGLHYKYMMENHGWNELDCKNFFYEINKGSTRFEWMGFEADEYRRKHSYPYIVCKELNKMMVNPIFENGGDNTKIIQFIEYLSHPLFISSTNVDYIVVQFSHPLRQVDISQYKSVDELVLEQVNKVNKLCERLNKKWFGISWINETAKIVKENYPDNYVPILYKDKEHLSMDERNPTIKELLINYNTKIEDSHPSKKGHEIMAKSIINKIKLSYE